MKLQPFTSAIASGTEQELERVELFIRHQSAVVMRACRMEIAQTPIPESAAKWKRIFFPWMVNESLRKQIRVYRKAVALQLLLEKQLNEALTYLNDPTEEAREQFVKGTFKAVYACEKYAYGEKSSHYIREVINDLGLQNY